MNVSTASDTGGESPLIWERIHSTRAKGHIDYREDDRSWQYDVHVHHGVFVAQVWNNRYWETIGQADTLEEAKHFCEMYEATGARV